jgi:hypothetical protein
MSTSLILAALLSLGASAKDAKKVEAPKPEAGKEASKAVQCPAWVYFEPHLWSRHIADASTTETVQEIDQVGAWIHVKQGAGEGYVPVTALSPPPGSGPTHDIVEGHLAKAGLTALDAWVIKYEGGGQTGGRFRARLEDLRTFVRDGYLEMPK